MTARKRASRYQKQIHQLLFVFTTLITLLFLHPTVSSGSPQEDPLIGVFSGSDHCSSWVKRTDVTCVFADRPAARWERKCTDPERMCKRRQIEHGICDAEDICVDPKINPNLLTSVCTEWVRHYGVRCKNEKSGRTENKWIRACQQAGVDTSACSDTPPEN